LSASEIQSCSDTLVVNAPTEWPPYSTKFNDDYVGLDIEIVKIIFKEANLCWSFAEYPSTPRVLAELERGRLDVVFAASYTPE
jgi:polar amino acid transport system substrate-binding protein